MSNETAAAQAAEATKKTAKKAGKGKPAKKASTKPEVPVIEGSAPAVKASNIVTLPEGIRVRVAVKSLVCARENQARVELTDEHTVSEYASKYAEAVADEKHPHHKDPARALPELRVIDTGENLYVWDGFQRTAALTVAGVAECWVISTKGTKKDAEFYALRANAAHGLRRNKSDCRRAVNTVLDDAELFARVQASADKYGGMTKAMAASCGVSTGLVSYVMAERGLKFDKNGEVKKATERRKTSSADTGSKPNTAAATSTTEHDQPSIPGLDEEAAQKEIKATATKVLFSELKKAAATLARIGEAIAERDDAGKILISACTLAKVPFAHAKGDDGKHEWDTLVRVIEAAENAERQYLADLEKAK